MAPTKAYLEQGKKATFALALDWPGWARRARTPDLALEELERYRSRYEKVLGHEVPTGTVRVVTTVTGTTTTDFGAPDTPGPGDERPFTKADRARQVDVLERCWRYFDLVVATSSPQLAKGPRGGGRDRDKIADHVREAERAYSSKIGQRIAPRTPWVEQREMILRQLKSGVADHAWPARYALRRIAWHVLDHAWEIEDKSVTA